MTTVEMLLRLGAGVGLGAVIGVERRYRARMAGLRTNALLAAGAALFVLLSAHGFHGSSADPTRVAAQIVSGIGFLGAGVIMRGGPSVRGLNTAATLWCSAAVGALSGSGRFGTALAGTIVVVAVEQALSRTDFRLVSISSRNTGETGQVEVAAELIGDERDDRQMESAVSALSLEPSVAMEHSAHRRTGGGQLMFAVNHPPAQEYR
jgi:putative Mg2+ transporter-C (MgtC) family protein